MEGIAVEPALAGVHGCNEHERRRVGEGGHCAGYSNRAVFERLAERFEDVPLELRKLVQKKHAVVREAHLAGFRHLSAADEPGVGNGVMRRTVRARRDERLALSQEPHDAVDLGRFNGLVKIHLRQDRRLPPREHGLTRARRAYHDDIVSACGRDLDGALGMFLALDFGEILLVGGVGLEGALDVDARGLHRGRARKELDDLRQRLHAEDLDRLDDSGFLRVVRRYHHSPITGLFREHGHGERAPHRFHPAVEGELADDQIAVYHFLGEDAFGDQHADGNREVEGGAYFFDVRGSEVYNDLPEGKIEAGVLERRAHPFLTLFYRRVRQPHGREEGEPPARDINFHLDRVGVDAQYRRAQHL